MIGIWKGGLAFGNFGISPEGLFCGFFRGGMMSAIEGKDGLTNSSEII